MKVIQSLKFKKVYKKLKDNQLHEVNDAIQKIMENPNIGEKKVGNLSWLRVYKFRCNNQLMLLGYENNNDIIKLHDLGSHENFYKKLN